jgi:hypothetical protein
MDKFWFAAGIGVVILCFLVGIALILYITNKYDK